MSASYRRIPYGVANFYDIRAGNKLFIDKTRFIHLLEDYTYVFFIRPRRFGKTCWITILENYYERNEGHRFDWWFGGLDIGKNPTEEHNRYVVVRFDFSEMNDAIDTLEETFETYGHTMLESMCGRYPDLFPESAAQKILGQSKLTDKLNTLFVYAKDHSIPLYFLIDEYDNFANTIFSQQGQTAYFKFTHGDGFYRNFFATLKGATTKGEGGLKRLFITGVSPMTMDDVTSEFNIGTNISLLPKFNEMLGFTETEVRSILEEYRDQGVFNQNIKTTLNIMKEWYNGYHFAQGTTTDVYNTDMVLHYLLASVPNEPGPLDLIDTNIRIDYGKLRHLMWVNHRLNGNFDRLKSIIEDGSITSPLVKSFSLEEVTDSQNFISLLYYFGLLSIADSRLNQATLKIPNRTVAELMYGYLRSVYREAEIFRVDLERFTHLIIEMALNADWKPVFTFLAHAIEQQTSIRDYLQGEKMIQGFLLAYLNVTETFLCHTEWECAKGYVDLYLEPFRDRYAELPYGFLIELKYLKRGESLNETMLTNTVEAAKTQLQMYMQDDQWQQNPSVTFIGILLVFHGWELVVCEAVKKAGQNHPK